MRRALTYLGNNALGALALFVALGGTTFAATGGFASGGKLQGCVNGNGKLTLLKSGQHCPKTQKTVAWNQKGPAGPKGQSGAPGTAGPAGATGPSDGFVARESGNTTLTAETATPIVQLTLPSGTGYVVTAAAELGNSSAPESSLVSCTLSDGLNILGNGSANEPGSNTFSQTITLTGATSGGVVTLSCTSENAGHARDGVITAVKVGALHAG
jgi:hypothetical protein